MWNVKTKVIPVIIGVTGTQKTAILGTAYILRIDNLCFGKYSCKSTIVSTLELTM